MKVSRFIILISFVIIASWLILSIVQVKNAQSRDDIIYSPDKSKSVEITNGIGTKQVIMNYHKNLMILGSNVMSGDLTEDNVMFKWIDNAHLKIVIPTDTKLSSRETEIQFFSEMIEIQYETK